MTRPTVFEFAGGGPAFAALATAHHHRCLDDPVLEHPFSHPGHPDHIQRLADYWAEVFGGPPAYSQADGGGQTALLAMHAGTGAQDDLGDLFLACFVKAIDDAQLPEDPEFRAVLRAYMEWATADVMAYAPEGSQVSSGLSVPHWSWDGLVDDESAAR